MVPELQKEFRAAFELVRTKRIDERIPEEGTGEPGDSPTTRANRAAFLALERERRVLAARLHRAHRHRSDRYRDLILITNLIHLEYEYLVGRVGPRARPLLLPDGLPALVRGTPADWGRDTPAEWAQPWGVRQMFGLREKFIDYWHRRDRLATRLSAASQASAAADAKRHLDRIFMSSGFEMVL
jgi:hypothetical protein